MFYISPFDDSLHIVNTIIFWTFSYRIKQRMKAHLTVRNRPQEDNAFLRPCCKIAALMGKTAYQLAGSNVRHFWPWK